MCWPQARASAIVTHSGYNTWAPNHKTIGSECEVPLMEGDKGQGIWQTEQQTKRIPILTQLNQSVTQQEPGGKGRIFTWVFM